MKNLFKNHRFWAGLLSVVVSVFLAAVVTYAATTIGTSIDTGGTVTMESASSTNDFWLGNVIADDDDSLFFDASGTEWLMWDDDPGEFDFTDDLNVGGGVTSTFAWIGAGGTANYTDLSNDLYVQGDAEVDGNLWITGTASSTSATTTDYLYVGDDITELPGWDFSGGDLIVSGAAHFAAKATSTTAFAVGAGTINNPDMSGGDLYVQGDAEIDGTAYFVNTTSTIATTTVLHSSILKLDPTATPTSLVTGKCFIDDTDYQLNCYNGTDWQYVW